MAGWLPGYGIASGGALMKIAEIDFTSLTPTDITVIGTTVIDGIDFVCDQLAAGSLIRIDGSGAYVVGGTGPCAFDIDLSTVNGGIDVSSARVWGLTVETNDLGTQWGAWVGDSNNDKFGIIRTLGSTMTVQRRIGGITGSIGQSVVENVQNVWGCVSAGPGVASSYDTAQPATLVSPEKLANYGISPASNGPGWVPFTGPGGVFRLYWNLAGGRDTRTTRGALWADG